MAYTHRHSDSVQTANSSYPDLNYTSGAKWIKHLTKGRLDTFTGGHFADVNLSSVLFTHRVDNSQHVKLQVWSAPGLSKPSFEEAMKQKFKPAKKGESFGPSCKDLAIVSMDELLTSGFMPMPRGTLDSFLLKNIC